MIISKELNKKQKNVDGNCPVVIIVSHMNKRREINTSVYVKESAWNTSATCVSKLDPDYKIKNEMIESLYRRVAGRIQSYLDSMLESGLDDVLIQFETSDYDSSESSLRLAELIEMKAKHVRAFNTRRGYESFCRYMKRCFPDNPSIDSFNRNFINDFRNNIEKDYSGNGNMRRIMISKFNAVMRFGRDNGYISSKIKLSLPSNKEVMINRNLSEFEMRIVFNAYNEAMTADPQFLKPGTEALALFVLDIAFQGLAPVDLANLRVKSMRFMTLQILEFKSHRYRVEKIYNEIYNNKEYDNSFNHIDVVTFQTSRTKTGRSVNIVSSTLGIESFLRKLTEGKTPDDYLIPCYNINKEYTPSQKQNRLANYFYMQAGNLNRALREYCSRHGIEQMRRITYYFARHAFCNLVDGMDIPRHLIQSMVGHRSSVLENSYLRPLTQWEQANISHTLLSRYFKPAIRLLSTI